MISFIKNVTIIAALTFIILASIVEETKSSGNSSAGQLTDERIYQLKREYSHLDKDRDGTINFQEFIPIMKSIEKNQTIDEIQEMFNHFDTDGSGTIDFNEYVAMMTAEGHNDDDDDDDNDEDIMKQAFQVFDKDGNGYISEDELHKTLTELGEKVTNLNVMIREYDLDGDGRINYEEFKKMMKSEPNLFHNNV